MPVNFIEHEGQRIVFMDFSRIQDPSVVLREIDEARNFVAQHPKRKELLVLVNLYGLVFNEEVVKAFRQLTKDDEPYEKAVAVYGFSSIGRVLLRASNMITGRHLDAFDNREEALKWLVKQASTPA